jgi:hypothetical protein
MAREMRCRISSSVCSRLIGGKDGAASATDGCPACEDPADGPGPVRGSARGAVAVTCGVPAACVLLVSWLGSVIFVEVPTERIGSNIVAFAAAGNISVANRRSGNDPVLGPRRVAVAVHHPWLAFAVYPPGMPAGMAASQRRSHPRQRIPVRGPHMPVRKLANGCRRRCDQNEGLYLLV